MIPAIGSGLGGASYEFLDAEWAGRTDGRYWLVDVDIFGRETRHGPIAIQPGTRTRGVRAR